MVEGQGHGPEACPGQGWDPHLGLSSWQRREALSPQPGTARTAALSPQPGTAHTVWTRCEGGGSAWRKSHQLLWQTLDAKGLRSWMKPVVSLTLPMSKQKLRATLQAQSLSVSFLGLENNQSSNFFLPRGKKKESDRYVELV